MDMTSRQMRDLTENWDYWPGEYSMGSWRQEDLLRRLLRGTEPVFSIDVATCAIDTIVNEQADFSGIHPVSDTEVIALRIRCVSPKGNRLCQEE